MWSLHAVCLLIGWVGAQGEKEEMLCGGVVGGGDHSRVKGTAAMHACTLHVPCLLSHIVHSKGRRVKGLQ